MKTIKTTLAVLAIVALVASCSKSNEITVTVPCKTTTFTFDYTTDVKYIDCVGRLTPIQYKPGTHQVTGTITEVYSYSNDITIVNNLGANVEARDLKMNAIIKPDSTLTYTGANEFSIHFDDGTVKGIATLIIGEEVTTVSNLTSSPVKFFANIPKGTAVKVVFTPSPSN